MFVAIHCHEPLVGAPPNPSIRRKYSAATRSENAFSCILESSKSPDSEKSQVIFCSIRKEGASFDLSPLT